MSLTIAELASLLTAGVALGQALRARTESDTTIWHQILDRMEATTPQRDAYERRAAIVKHDPRLADPWEESARSLCRTENACATQWLTTRFRKARIFEANYGRMLLRQWETMRLDVFIMRGWDAERGLRGAPVRYALELLVASSARYERSWDPSTKFEALLTRAEARRCLYPSTWRRLVYGWADPLLWQFPASPPVPPWEEPVAHHPAVIRREIASPQDAV